MYSDSSGFHRSRPRPAPSHQPAMRPSGLEARGKPSKAGCLDVHHLTASCSYPNLVFSPRKRSTATSYHHLPFFKYPTRLSSPFRALDTMADIPDRATFTRLVTYCALLPEQPLGVPPARYLSNTYRSLAIHSCPFRRGSALCPQMASAYWL